MLYLILRSVFINTGKSSINKTAAGSCATKTAQGFSLIEMMIALFILSFGILAVGQLIFVSLASSSLSRSKGTAATAAKDKLEYLADLYRQNPSATDLTPGNHGPQVAKIFNPNDGRILNEYNVSWSVSGISDPRPGKVPQASLVIVTITPIRSGGIINIQPYLNKVVNVASIFSSRMK